MNILYYLAANEKIDVTGIPKVDADTVLATGLNMFYFAAGAVAVIVIILSGFRFVLSIGDSGSIKKAKDMILYAVIGLVVIIIAAAITQFIIGVFK